MGEGDIDFPDEEGVAERDQFRRLLRSLNARQTGGGENVPLEVIAGGDEA